MKLDGRRELEFQKVGDSLPMYLDQYNPTKVSARPLGDQDECLSCAILGQIPITEFCLHDGDDLIPVDEMCHTLLSEKIGVLDWCRCHMG